MSRYSNDRASETFKGHARLDCLECPDSRNCEALWIFRLSECSNLWRSVTNLKGATTSQSAHKFRGTMVRRDI